MARPLLSINIYKFWKKLEERELDELVTAAVTEGLTGPPSALHQPATRLGDSRPRQPPQSADKGGNLGLWKAYFINYLLLSLYMCVLHSRSNPLGCRSPGPPSSQSPPFLEPGLPVRTVVRPTFFLFIRLSLDEPENSRPSLFFNLPNSLYECVILRFDFDPKVFPQFVIDMWNVQDIW